MNNSYNSIFISFALGIAITATVFYFISDSVPYDSFEVKAVNQPDAHRFSTREEQKSPHDIIKEEDILVFNDKVIINIENPQWASFEDTNSMDPVLDIGSNAIQIIPKTNEEILEGDIISYRSDYADGIFIHRVVEQGNDEKGWYIEAKGDNNILKDPGKIRFAQITHLNVAVIY